MKLKTNQLFLNLILTLLICTPFINTTKASEVISESDFLTTESVGFTLDYHPPDATQKLTRVASFVPEEPVPNDSTMVVLVEFDVEASAFVVGLEAGKSNGSTEIFRRQSITPSQKYALWLLERRIGNARPTEKFYLEVGGFNRANAKLKRFEVHPLSYFSVDQLMEATSYEPVTMAYKELATDWNLEQEVNVAFPKEIARRFIGQEVAVIFDSMIKKFPITLDDVQDRDLWEKRISLPVDLSEIGTRKVSVVIQTTDDEKLFSIGEDTFRVIGVQGNVVDSFEMPFREYKDYTVFYNKPDLRIIALPTDIYSKPEPLFFESSSHEMVDYIVSLESGNYRPHVGWRIPPFDHWAEEGFRHLSIGKLLDSYAIYASGGNAEGLDIIGHGAVIDGAPLGSPIKNPIYFPHNMFAGWKENHSIELRSAGAALYAGNFLHIIQSHVYGEPRRMIAAISNDITKLLDIKRLPDLEDAAPNFNLQLFEHDGYYFLLADKTMWRTDKPFDYWETIEVEFPENIYNFKRLRIGEGRDYIFGLEIVEGRSILRWEEITWTETDDGPVPEFGFEIE